MDIQDRVAEALQITFLEILDEHAIRGVYCSRDMAPDDDQGEEMIIDGQLTCDLATMPRSINVLGKGHPFVSTNQGIMARCILARLVGAGSIKIIKKAGAGIIITEPLKGLVNTIRQCTAHTMSPAIMTKWLEIPMLESDLKQLTKVVEEHLWRTNFVWLFADPGQLTAPPILELDMQDQERQQEAFTVCKLDKRDARFLVGTWIFGAIHTLVAEGKVVIQKVGNRNTQRTGYMVISPDAERTFEAQYGPLAMATNRLKSARLGDDDHAREQLLQLEIDKLESLLDEASDKILLVTGAESTEGVFKFTEGQTRGDPAADIDVVTNGLARKSGEHQMATIYLVRSQGKKVLGIQGGVLLVPSGHALAMWDPNDVRLSRWHPSRPLEELLQEVREMDPVDPKAAQNEIGSWADQSQSPRSDPAEDQNAGPAERVRMECSWESELTKRPAQDMATVSEAMRELRARENNDPRLLQTVEANANSTHSIEFNAINATRVNENEWITKAEATGPITFTIRLAQKARVVGIWLRHGEQRKIFTQVEVTTKDGSHESNLVIIPPNDAGNRPHYAWLQHPIQGKLFELIFNADSAHGSSGSAGLKYVALAGYVSDEGEKERKKKRK